MGDLSEPAPGAESHEPINSTGHCSNMPICGRVFRAVVFKRWYRVQIVDDKSEPSGLHQQVFVLNKWTLDS